MNGFIFFIFIFWLMQGAQARPYYAPQTRYQNALSQSMGGITLPFSDEVGNSLFNNPAALGRNIKFRAEYINLNIEADSNFVGGAGVTSPSMMGLGGLTKTLNENVNKVYGSGIGNLTAFSWGGFAFGLLIQERGRSVSSGTQVQYETVSQMVPAIGYGVSLARGAMRLGYSLQFVNQAAGVATDTSDSGASYLKGIKEGKGFSQNASVNFVFPYAYIPTFSFIGRNLGGLHFLSGSYFKRAKSPTGVPDDEPMSLDAAMNFSIRVSPNFRFAWYFQYKDFTQANAMAAQNRLSVGLDIQMSKSFGIRGGLEGIHPSVGLGYQSESSEINLSWFQDMTPFSNISLLENRYVLQYKIFFQDKNTRNRDKEK